MKRLFTKEQLESYLQGMDREQLEDLIYELYCDSGLAARKLEMQFVSDEVSTRMLEEYKKSVRKVFFPSASSFKADTSKAGKILREFEKICPDLEEQGELMVEILDCEMEILSYGYTSSAFMDSFNSVLDQLCSVVCSLKDCGGCQMLNRKIQCMMENSCECEQDIQQLLRGKFPQLMAA